MEPLISTQWFCKSTALAPAALEAVREGRTRIVPERFEKIYSHWMENIRDWCISRQLWWGHRIPVWYGPDDTQFVELDEVAAHEQARSHYGRDVALHQDEDVLDTWFSSGLWPFSTLGWPENTEDLPLLLSDQRARNRLRHPILLGGAHDDAGHPSDRQGAV